MHHNACQMHEYTFLLIITLMLSDLYFLDPSGWWLGRLKGKEGLFPSNYVETI